MKRTVPEKNDISQQIKKYLDGKLDARAMHELERRAQDDPFLMDAMDGYQHTPADIDEGLNDLNNRLQDRTDKRQARIIPWRTISIAASILMLLGLGLFWYNDHKSLPETRQKIALTPPPPVQKWAALQDTATPQDKTTATNDVIAKQKMFSRKNRVAVNTRKARPALSQASVNAAAETIPVPTVVSEPQPGATEDKEAMPLNEMVVMAYSAQKKANDQARDKPVDTILGPLVKGNSAQNKTDTLGFKITRIKGTDIAKLREDQNGYNANVSVPGVPSQNMLTYQQQQPLLNSVPLTARINASVPMRGYFGKKPAASGGIAPLNPIILHGRLVKGMVKALGEPLPYASVKIKGTNISTLTDSKGKFTLYSVPDSAIIQVIADGYVVKETKVTRRNMQVVSIRPFDEATNDTGTDNFQSRPSTGWDDFNNYLHQNAVSADGRAGTVKLSFAVNADNSLSDFKIIRSLGTQTDNAAIKLIKDGPAWYSPYDDKPQTISLSIKFHARGK